MSELYGPVFAKNDYAGFVRRMAALAIDVLLMLLLLMIGSVAAALFVPERLSLRASGLITCVWFAVALVYNFTFRMADNGTLGYRLVGIRYAFMLDQRPSRMWRISRALWATFLTMCFGLNHIWILADPCKQAWHDKMSGFYVVKRHAQPTGKQRIVRRLINFLGYTFYAWEPQTEAE